MSTQKLLTEKLKSHKVDFIHFVDISQLPNNQNKGFSSAILFGIVLTKAYLKEITNTPNYVEKMKQIGQIQNDEFHLTEIKTDRIADELANFLTESGFKAYSQSEANIEASGFYNKKKQTTPLPHKTIAGLAGLGWIGKHNLMVSPHFGSAFSMCSVLTNAPLETVRRKPVESLCGACRTCIDICTPNALSGNKWNINTSRDKILNHKKCATCLECMIHCPWTQKYLLNNK